MMMKEASMASNPSLEIMIVTSDLGPLNVDKVDGFFLRVGHIIIYSC
uniref:Uncharacterized protein n=1 Tax=Rhizophora mucronata TaxID=61149 RepID=A0A2P2MZX1_RHIMU